MWQPSFDASNKRTRWLFCISAGVYLNLFILFFQPYSKEIFAYDSPVYYQFVFGGIVTVVFGFTSITIPNFFPHYFAAPRFTVSRFLIWYFTSGLMCHVPGFFYDNWLTHRENTWAWFLTYEILYAIPTLIFISIPFLIVLNFIFRKTQDNPPTTIEQYNNESAQEIAQDIVQNSDKEKTHLIDANPTDVTIEKEAPQYKSLPDDAVIQLTNASGTGVFEINKAQLLYMTSANNYVEIFYLNDKQTLTRTLLRQTLTEMERQLVTENGVFCRCHKAFIINKEKIISVTGNAKGYNLILAGVAKPIPVSRKKNDTMIAQYIHLLNA